MDANDVAEFYIQNGLTDFYNSRKKTEVDMSWYENHDRLKNYTALKCKSDLVPLKTYVKYISYDNSCKSDKSDKYIMSGGILIGCGKMVGNTFVSVGNPAEYTHLILKFDPKICKYEDGLPVEKKLKSRSFIIKITKNHIYYRYFEKAGKSFFRRQIEKLQISFVDRHGNKIN